VAEITLETSACMPNPSDSIITVFGFGSKARSAAEHFVAWCAMRAVYVGFAK
jgi:hypothetical protein